MHIDQNDRGGEREILELMFYASLALDLDVVRAVRSASTRVPEVAADYFAQTVMPTLTLAVDQHVAPYPGPVKYPFQFASVKSRKAYFATRGFGKGIPSRRTGFLGDSWVVRIDRRRVEGIITLRNIAAYADYVLGHVHQTPGHATTGWGGVPLAQGLAQFEQTAINQLVDAWAVVVDKAVEIGR